MTKEKLKSVFAFYRAELDGVFPQIAPAQMGETFTTMKQYQLGIGERVPHYKFMCDEAQKFVDEGRIEKAMRWLGFLQGVFWATGIYTLDDVKHHSMP